MTQKVSPVDLERRDLIKAVANAQMRALLHNPKFQRLEALWRSVDFLVRRANSDCSLKVWLIDISQQELTRDLDPGSGELARSLYDRRPWASLVGAYSFGANDDELRALSTLGELAERFDASFVGAAKLELVGCESIDSLMDPEGWLPPSLTWEKFRTSQSATYIGLVMPRFLLRLTYGEKTDQCEIIEFEEMGLECDHERLLWGNGAFICASLVAESFEDAGWSMRLGNHLDVCRLPTYVYKEYGAAVAQPCGETLMTDRAAMAMQERGVMCLASIKDSDAVLLVRFQSVSKTLRPLPGRWTQV